MKYFLQNNTIESYAQKEITEDCYIEITAARQILFEILAIEEKYDLLIRNYLEFERAIYKSSISGLIYTERSWSDFIEHIQSINLVLMNLLSMCRSYIDHTPQNIASIFPNNPEKLDAFHKVRNGAYDEFLGYRALYEIRNHVQHCGLPVHSFILGSSWVKDKNICRHNATPYVSVEELEKNKNFKKKIIQELQAIGKRVDLILLVRENMSAFGKLQKCVRSLVKELAENSEEIISRCLSDYAADINPNLVGLSIVKIGDDDIELERSSLFNDMIERRKYLERRNKTLVNYEQHFVSGQI